MKNKKIGIAMSGGVDSTACALLLRGQYQVQGFFMQLAQPNFQQQKEQVQTVADKLGIKLQIINLQQQFEQKVLDYFSGSYFKGLTPNPCVVCNREIKFGLFMDAIIGAGMDMIATGHYARLESVGGKCHLYQGADNRKDQSYFLSRLSQKQLQRVLFPLSKMNKEETYQLVEEHGFDDFRGRESQDVCFLENNQIGSFLDSQKSKNKNCAGPIVSTSGKILGQHRGLFHYTIGQRKGLGISSETPLYVTALDLSGNRVIVGKNEELFTTTIKVKNLHWISNQPPDLSRDYIVRIRYSHRGSPARLEIDNKGFGTFTFNEPQRAVTPGQFGVVYQDTELLGSGIIFKD